MPSIVLNHRSSFSLLYHDRVPFPLTRVFGCVVFVHVLNSRQYKLSPKLISVFSLGTLILRRAIVITILSPVDTL
jgi:hypothetical protein